MGLGHVAVRELVSFLKYSKKDFDGNNNPVDVELLMGGVDLRPAVVFGITFIAALIGT